MSEAETSSNSSPKGKNGIEDMKMFCEAIKSVVQQMPESNEVAIKYGLMASEMIGNAAEAVELGRGLGGKKEGIALCTLLAMVKQQGAMLNEGKENEDLARAAQEIQNISQLFGNVAEQIPNGHSLKAYSDTLSAMFSGTAEHMAASQHPIASMAGGLFAALKCANKYPKPNNVQKAQNSRKNVAQQQQKTAKEFVKEVAKATGGISQLILQICGGEMKATVQNTANGTNALVQSAMVQGAQNVHHVNLQIQKEADLN